MARRKKKNLELGAFEALQKTYYVLSKDIYNEVAGRPLTTSQFRALEGLYRFGPMYQKDVATYISKSTGNIVTVIDSLEKNKLVERVRDKDDRRYFMIHLTQEGEKLITKLNKTYLNKVKKEMGIFSEKELSEIINLGAKIESEI